MFKRLFITLLVILPFMATCSNDSTIEEIEPKMDNIEKNSRNDNTYFNLGFLFNNK